MTTMNVTGDRSREAGLCVLGAATFGVAAAAGHGVRAMAQGAWAAPAVFLGGAALALPPLYLFGALAGARSSTSDVLGAVTRSTARVGAALLGLAVPAAFFSTTLGGFYAEALVVGVAVVVGVSGIVAVSRVTPAAGSPGAKLAMVAWAVFALALGARLLSSVGRASGLFGGV